MMLSFYGLPINLEPGGFLKVALLSQKKYSAHRELSRKRCSTAVRRMRTCIFLLFLTRSFLVSAADSPWISPRDNYNHAMHSGVYISFIGLIAIIVALVLPFFVDGCEAITRILFIGGGVSIATGLTLGLGGAVHSQRKNMPTSINATQKSKDTPSTDEARRGIIPKYCWFWIEQIIWRTIGLVLLPFQLLSLIFFLPWWIFIGGIQSDAGAFRTIGFGLYSMFHHIYTERSSEFIKNMKSDGNEAPGVGPSSYFKQASSWLYPRIHPVHHELKQSCAWVLNVENKWKNFWSSLFPVLIGASIVLFILWFGLHDHAAQHEFHPWTWWLLKICIANLLIGGTVWWNVIYINWTVPTRTGPYEKNESDENWQSDAGDFATTVPELVIWGTERRRMLRNLERLKASESVSCHTDL